MGAPTRVVTRHTLGQDGYLYEAMLSLIDRRERVIKTSIAGVIVFRGSSARMWQVRQLEADNAETTQIAASRVDSEAIMWLFN